MRKRLTITGLVCLMFFLLAPTAFGQENVSEEKAAEKEASPKSDKTVAKVNDAKITQAELDQEMAPIRQQMAMQGQPVDDAQMNDIQKKVLDEMVRRELLWQESQKKGLGISDEEVEESLEQFKSRFPDEKTFKEGIEKMGISLDTVRHQIRQQRSIQKLLEEKVIDDIEVTEADAKRYFDENQEMFDVPAQLKASHILVQVEENASEAEKAEARKKIEGIRKEVTEGADFAEMAKEKSDGPSGERGGDLGYFGRGQMVKPFEDAAFALKAGEISEIVETRFGFHIIKALDKKPAGKMSFDDAKPRIEQILQRQMAEKAVEAYIQSLTESAKIEITL